MRHPRSVFHLALITAGFLHGLEPGLRSAPVYLYVPGDFTWPEAKMDAERHGGTLATITSDAENRIVSDLFNGKMWLGGFQPSGSSEPKGNWQWVTGEPWSFTSWHSGQPDNDDGGQDYLTDNHSTVGRWDDESSTNRLGYALEIRVPTVATATARVINGFIVGITVTDGGSGYQEAPRVRITGGGGSGAVAVAQVGGGAVTAIDVVSPGIDFAGPPSVQIDPPPLPVRNASAIAEIVNGFLVGLRFTQRGYGYTAAPAVTVVGGGGSGATVVAEVSGGGVTGYKITNPGVGYTGVPAVVFDPPPFEPQLKIKVSRITVSLTLVLGVTYVLESSQDLVAWVVAGSPFVAVSETLDQEFPVSEAGRYFRVRAVK